MVQRNLKRDEWETRSMRDVEGAEKTHSHNFYFFLLSLFFLRLPQDLLDIFTDS